MDIIDFHCDLLGSIVLSRKPLHFNSPETNCSLIQIKKGGIKLQILPIYTDEGQGRLRDGQTQLQLFEDLLVDHKQVVLFNGSQLAKEQLNVLLAIENLSSFLLEDEHLDLVFKRLTNLISRPIYVSLTWKYENRFGGGDSTKVGLKNDGKEVLQYLADRNICIDLSHTSDMLAYDILNYIHQKGLHLIPIASHSNFRQICNHQRNLVCEVAQEIAKLGGVIGLCFVKRFVGHTEASFYDHLTHAESLGLLDHIVMGSDFYGEIGFDDPFFKNFSNASTIRTWVEFMGKRCSEEVLFKLTHQNGLNFLHKRYIS